LAELLTRGIVRILDGNRDTAGTGFVISESGLIATCSHVIQHETLQERGTPKPEKVTIVFHATGDEQDARVEPQWWLPWNAGDLAILRVEGILPQGIQPLPLGSAAGTNGHEVSAFGFPNIDDIEGIGADGRVVRVLLNAGRSTLQLRSSEITTGFSGAPIWDTLGRRVIGMVSAITEPDRHHRLTETAFALATETLRDVCPVLRLSEVCPYRGLAAFTEADTEFFFGRQQIVDGLLHRLRRDPRFLTVLGPSGSGKSSVVQAGLIPHLRSGKVPGSDRWGTIVTRPAAQPFDELSKQGVVDESYELTESVREWMGQHTEHERLMLVVDQFEELFSMCPEAIRQDFITQVVKLLHSPLLITVVLVMRDDFYSRLTQQAALVEWLERSQGSIHVPKLLKHHELIAMVQKPIEAVGLRCEEGLVETIVQDTLETSSESEEGGPVGRSAVLPLLEFALTELWKRRQEGMLTHEAYRSIGGVTGALSQWADRALYALKPGERQLAQRILIDQVYVGDERQGILDSRRRRTLTSLCRNESEQEPVQAVVQQLVEDRILATDRDLQSNEETVEIIHDVLLREWGQLQQWLEADRRFLTWHQELERLVHGWGSRHDKNKLLRGQDLTEAKGWLQKRGADLNQEEVAFLHASAVHRRWNVVRVSMVFLLLIALLGVAGRFFLNQAHTPDYVTTTDDSAVGSLRWAIGTAHAGDTITFAPSLAGQTFVLKNADLHIFQQHLTILGPATGRITIREIGAGFIVDPFASAAISDVAFQGSNTKAQASLIQNQGKLTLKDCSLSGNKATVTGINRGGGGIANDGTLTLTNCTISDNTTSNSFGGGGIYNDHGTLTLINSTVSGNTTSTTNGGGGIINEAGRLTLTNSTVSGNTTSNSIGGGGIENSGTLTLTNSTVSGNTAPGVSGGIDNTGTLTLTNSIVSGNTTSFGGGIGNSGTLTLTNCTVSDNTASGGVGFQG